MLLASAAKLRTAGADLLICPNNTAHQAPDLVRDRSPLPWLHMAEEVTTVAADRGFRRTLVLGTRDLMESPVYPAKQLRFLESARPQADKSDSLKFLTPIGTPAGRGSGALGHSLTRGTS